MDEERSKKNKEININKGTTLWTSQLTTSEDNFLLEGVMGSTRGMKDQPYIYQWSDGTNTLLE